MLPLLAGLVITGIINNSLKLRWPKRIGLFIGVCLLAYFFGYVLTARLTAPPTQLPSTVAPATVSGSTETRGDNSPVIQNNQGSVTINTAKPEEKDKK